VEPGETPAEAVVREVREETGLDVGVIELLMVVPFEGEGFSYAIHEFLCAIAMKEGGGSATPGDDAAEVTWALPSELETLGVSSGVRSVVARGLGRMREIAC
jgi:8-oxo-dGTP diphosphatase